MWFRPGLYPWPHALPSVGEEGPLWAPFPSGPQAWGLYLVGGGWQLPLAEGHPRRGKAGVWRALAADTATQPPGAVAVCGEAAGIPGDSSCQPSCTFSGRTLGPHCGRLRSQSLFPRFGGQLVLPEASMLCTHVLGVQQGLGGLQIPFLDPTDLPSESHNSSSKPYCLNCEIYVNVYVFFKLTL